MLSGAKGSEESSAPSNPPPTLNKPNEMQATASQSTPFIVAELVGKGARVDSIKKSTAIAAKISIPSKSSPQDMENVKALIAQFQQGEGHYESRIFGENSITGHAKDVTAIGVHLEVTSNGEDKRNCPRTPLFEQQANQASLYSPQIDTNMEIAGKVTHASFNALNAKNLPADKELVTLFTEYAKSMADKGIGQKVTVTETGEAKHLQSNIGNLDFALSHSLPIGGSKAQPISPSSTAVLPHPILTQFNLLSPRDSSPNIRLFLKNAISYRDTLKQEMDEDIVEMNKELETVLIECKKDIKSVDKAKRQQIRVKIKEIEEIKEANNKKTSL